MDRPFEDIQFFFHGKTLNGSFREFRKCLIRWSKYGDSFSPFEWLQTSQPQTFQPHRGLGLKSLGLRSLGLKSLGLEFPVTN